MDHPKGGYFISLDVVDGTANRVWELARDAGILLTQAGSAFPYGQDDNDRNIRLAPTLPPQEVEAAIDGVATCVLLAAVEKLGPNINADESALWLSEIIPAPLEFRYVDERRLGLASLADAQSLALTTTFNATDTGLQSQDDGTDVRCELLTVARTGSEVAAAINAAADTFERPAACCRHSRA